MLTLLLALSIGFAQTPVDSAMTRGGVVNTERQGGPFGMGIGIGAPSGLVGKYWIGKWSAFQFSAGGDIGEFQDLVGVADYILQFRPFDTGEPDVSVPLHVGAGFNLGGNFNDNVAGVWRIGPRAVLGVSVLMKNLPIDIYVETAPTLYIYEEAGWSIDGQIGLRHYR
jgi:hypothetical protein